MGSKQRYALERLVVNKEGKHPVAMWQQMVFCGNRPLLETLRMNLRRPWLLRISPVGTMENTLLVKGIKDEHNGKLRVFPTEQHADNDETMQEDRESEWRESRRYQKAV